MIALKLTKIRVSLVMTKIFHVYFKKKTHIPNDKEKKRPSLLSILVANKQTKKLQYLYKLTKISQTRIKGCKQNCFLFGTHSFHTEFNELICLQNNQHTFCLLL